MRALLSARQTFCFDHKINWNWKQNKSAGPKNISWQTNEATESCLFHRWRRPLKTGDNQFTFFMRSAKPKMGQTLFVCVWQNDSILLVWSDGGGATATQSDRPFYYIWKMELFLSIFCLRCLAQDSLAIKCWLISFASHDVREIAFSLHDTLNLIMNFRLYLQLHFLVGKWKELTVPSDNYSMLRHHKYLALHLNSLPELHIIKFC